MGSVLIGNGSWFAPVGGGVPVNTAAPSISGTAQVGQVLTGSDGTWTGTVNSTERVFQLSANGTSGWADIPGATGTTYTPVTGDATQYVRFGVRKTGPGGTSSWVYSAASAQIAAASADAPVNSAAPTLTAWRGTAGQVGAILQVNAGSWVDGAYNEAVTVTNVSAASAAGYSFVSDLTLSAPLSRAWRSGMVYTEGGAVFHVLSVTGNVIRVAGVGTIPGGWEYNQPFTPSTGGTGKYVTMPPLQRTFRWKRDGAVIAGATAPVYTVQAADLGTTITVEEGGYYWNTPGVITWAPSAGMAITSGSIASALVLLADMEYAGSFGFNAHGGTEALPGRGISMGSFSGNPTLYVGDHQGSALGRVSFAEYQIPALATYVGGHTGLNLASAVRTSAPVDPTEGGVAALGTAGGEQTTIYGTLRVGNFLIASAANPYSADQTGAFWRRPDNLATTGQVSAPWFVDDLRHSTSRKPGTRSTAGYMCHVPATLVNGVNYQTALGGDILSGNCKLSVEAASSRKPTAIAWNSADITTALSNAVSGTVVSGTTGSGGTSTVTLDAAANYDVTGQRILITNGPGYNRYAHITAFNTSTKVAQVTSLRGPTIQPYPSFTVTAATRANPVVVTLTGGGAYFDAGETAGCGARISGVGGMTQLNGNVYYLVPVGGNNFALYSDKALTTPVNGTAFGTYTSGGAAACVPDTGSTYVISPRIDGFMLCGDAENDLVPPPLRDNVINGIWQEGGGPVGMCIPNGTRSLLFIGAGYDGPQEYGPMYNIPNDGSGQGPIIYDPEGVGTGPHGRPYSIKVYAYDLDELVAAKNLSANFYDVRPYGIWTIAVPNHVNAQRAVQSVTYDPATRRVYLTTFGGPNSRGICHAFTVTKAVVA